MASHFRMTGHSGDTITGAQRALRAAGDMDRARGWIQREKRKQRSPWLRTAGQAAARSALPRMV
jgi:hypothetical protein